MAGKIHIVRHGQGRANVAINPDPNDPRLRDAELTTSGALQSVALGKKFPHMEEIGIILISPLRRSIQTALLAFSGIIHERFYLPGEGGIPGGVDLVVDPKLQEIGDETWNTGSTTDDLIVEFPKLDLSLLTSPWPAKSGQFDPARVKQRATDVRSDLWDRIVSLETQSMRKDIVVVSHGGFLPELTNKPNWRPETGSYLSMGISKRAGNVQLS